MMHYGKKSLKRYSPEVDEEDPLEQIRKTLDVTEGIMLKGTSREFARIFNIDGEAATAYLLEGKEALVQTHFKGTYEIARIGSYVIVPVGADRLVGLITKLRVEEP
jgi:hypothetical protein